MLDGSDFPDFVRCIMLLDSVRYLPDDILTKIDRASIAVGLELRAPLPDKDLMDFARYLPLKFGLSLRYSP